MDSVGHPKTGEFSVHLVVEVEETQDRCLVEKRDDVSQPEKVEVMGYTALEAWDANQ